MTGPDVAVIQFKLQEKGYLAGKADGIFGLSTEAAVKQYQQERALSIKKKDQQPI